MPSNSKGVSKIHLAFMMAVILIAYVVYLFFPGNLAEVFYGVGTNAPPQDQRDPNLVNFPTGYLQSDPENAVGDASDGNYISESQKNAYQYIQQQLQQNGLQDPFYGENLAPIENPVQEQPPSNIRQHFTSQTPKKYEANWDSLDSRPLPTWYDDAKFGIFVHWGVFSVPAFGSEWFWWSWQGQKDPEYIEHMRQNYKPGFKYADFAPMFTAEYFNPDEWAELFESAGARYVVLTSKHHEGYTNWPSKVSYGWNSVDAGPGRDLVGEFAEAIHKKPDLHFGLYHSLYEWFNPLYLTDKENDFHTQYFVASKSMPGLYEVVNTYKPDIVWSDGQWEASHTYWNSTQFLSWLYNESPVKDTVVTNDRWGNDTDCRNGDFITCQDRYNPGKLVHKKWENCMTIDKKSWGYRRNAPLKDYYGIKELIAILAETVSCGGNLLMNVAPTADGRILPIYEERLRQMGEWLTIHGEAIYGTRPWRYQEDPSAKGIWYTYKPAVISSAVYAILTDWPPSGIITLTGPRPTTATTVTMVGIPTQLSWSMTTDGQEMVVQLPVVAPSVLPSQWAWVLRFHNLG